MFGWLLGKEKNHKAGHKPKSTSSKSARPPEASDSVLPDFAHEMGHPKTALEEASDRAMQQRREQRRVDRMGRREALFGIVREIMLRSGILSSAYKFKVLSIDQKGRHFLVLLDLSMELAQSEPADRLLEIEKLIADTSMARMQVVVQAVYWRHFVPGQAATVRLSSGDTQPGGLSAQIGMGKDAAATTDNSARSKAAETVPERKFENSAADAISTALAELRAKNRAKAQERAAEQQALSHAAASADATLSAAAGTAIAATATSTTFAATQMITASRLATEGTGQTQFFAETQMQTSPGQADDDELAAFQRALQGSASATTPKFDDAPASIFISGKALEGQLEEQFVDGGIDLSGTQYGELPKF